MLEIICSTYKWPAWRRNIWKIWELTLQLLSVFLLPRPGLSYLTSEIFCGIILFVPPREWFAADALMEEKTKNLREKFGCLSLEMLHERWSTKKTCEPIVSTRLTCREFKAPDIQNFGFVHTSIYLSSYLPIIYLFIHLFRSNQEIAP